MLRDDITPEERLVACPNQDLVYGFGVIDAHAGPSVVQVPDFGDRFWVYQVVDQRTDSFVRLGAMYDTTPGLYLLAHVDWDGEVPDCITDTFRFDTRIAVCIPRIFMDDTDADRAAIQPIINQVMVYPLDQYTGQPQTTDWAQAPTFPVGDATGSEQETQWVDPEQFFTLLPEVLTDVPTRPARRPSTLSSRACWRPPTTTSTSPPSQTKRSPPKTPCSPSCSNSATSASPSRRPLEHPNQLRRAAPAVSFAESPSVAVDGAIRGGLPGLLMSGSTGCNPRRSRVITGSVPGMPWLCCPPSSVSGVCGPRRARREVVDAARGVLFAALDG
ncbi:hypothetical protein BN12_30058 [Nostocoides japonicum T1-X7]|uniref:DUF1254 domain-containing protein n=1 Tax=Nostocoides japonicum T1-X7 TaxID=1194083 RepID=A0A077M081_9MICO|nr:DUF1254 domain-containing protein [Tetrasphaera japonica]CCH78532.1 hypothetical protein BN12_30058 [Tetrasphaera japonica T1-X7]